MEIRPGSKDRLFASTVVVAIPVSRIYANWLDNQPSFCPVLRICGVPCPLCGGTRSVLLLVSGDPIGAFKMNAGVFLLSVFCGIVLISRERQRRFPPSCQ